MAHPQEMPVSPPSGTRIWVPVSLTHSQEERAELQSSLCKTGVPTLAPPRKDPRDSEVLGVSTLGSGWGARETSGRSPRAKEEPPSPGVQEQKPLVEQSRRRPQDTPVPPPRSPGPAAISSPPAGRRLGEDRGCTQHPGHRTPSLLPPASRPEPCSVLENLTRRWQAQLVHGPRLFGGSGLGTKSLVTQF